MSGQHRQTPIYLQSSGQHEITYGVASALFGGTAPLVNALLVQRTGNPSFPPGTPPPWSWRPPAEPAAARVPGRRRPAAGRACRRPRPRSDTVAGGRLRAPAAPRRRAEAPGPDRSL